MSLVSILVMASLVAGPAAGASSRQQDAPASSNQASAPVGPTHTAPAESESQGAQQSSDSAAKNNAGKAPQNKVSKRRRIRKRPPGPPLEGEPRKIVVREGGASEPPAQIVPGVAPQEASKERQNAVELLSKTEENLKLVAGRAMDSQQQETVAQIRNYVEGARYALKDGDTQRARTLALKAHLLADDLVKH